MEIFGVCEIVAATCLHSADVAQNFNFRSYCLVEIIADFIINATGALCGESGLELIPIETAFTLALIFCLFECGKLQASLPKRPFFMLLAGLIYDLL